MLRVKSRTPKAPINNSIIKGQAAIIAFTRTMRDTTGNPPPLPGIFPEYLAHVVRNESRCVVPWTSFCKYAHTKPKKTPTWFAFGDERPLSFGGFETVLDGPAAWQFACFFE